VVRQMRMNTHCSHGHVTHRMCASLAGACGNTRRKSVSGAVCENRGAVNLHTSTHGENVNAIHTKPEPL
jgi:hypothetical protein